MAHELSEVSGRVEMFAAGERPWHGLGVNVPERVTAREAIRLAGLGWPVEQVAAGYMDAVGHYMPVPDKVCNIRRKPSGSPIYLATVGNGYRVIQNTEAFDFLDSLVGSGEAVFESAGAIRDGRRVWVLAKLREDMVVKAPGGPDVTKQYLLFVNSHDGTMACRCFYSPVRVVCNNTLTSALSGREQEGVVIYHKGDIQSKVTEAGRILQLATSHYTKVQEVLERMAKVSLKIHEAEEYFLRLVPDVEEHGKRGQTIRETTRSGMLDRYRRGAGAGLAGDTLYGAYNAVTAWADHQSFEQRKARSDFSRFESTIYGPMSHLKQKAFDVARDRVQVAVA